jgi:uncharacterized protein YcaQ
MPAIRSITPQTARRLIISKQQLAGPPLPATRDGMLALFRALRCVQIDPTSAVARSQKLVLWSRLGNYDENIFENLMWQERSLFEYWAHAASVVLSEDFPIHALRMRRYTLVRGVWRERMRQWMQDNLKLKRHILSNLRRSGPMRARDLETGAFKPVSWKSSGWTNDRNVSRMLDFLWYQGVVLVAGRAGGQKQWDLAERCLPDWTPRKRLSQAEGVRQAAQHSLRALGIGTAAHIDNHFIRANYPNLPHALHELERSGTITRVRVAERSSEWPGTWYVHSDDEPLVDALSAGEWQPRNTLLSPFDNLICDRERTEELFGFRFRLEIYTPRHKRQHGFFVMPILDGDRLIGRVDPFMDRKQQKLLVHAVHVEPHLKLSAAAGRATAKAISELAAFLGARDIQYGALVPERWRRWMR